MKLEAHWARYTLNFTFEAVTSRERMWHKDTYLVKVFDSDNPEVIGVGECGLFKGLSADDKPDYEAVLDRICRHPDEIAECHYTSIRFGFETALADLANGGRRIIYSSSWTKGLSGVKTNGLIWMGDKATMERRIDEKLANGFKVLKLKIGGIRFEEECELLSIIRRRYNAQDLEIRLDANGSFNPATALRNLQRLADFNVHSIEQPLPKGMIEQTAKLCEDSPLAIALDEELIGWHEREEVGQLLDAIKPRYVILKPTLIGGVKQSDVYIEEATKRGIGWWATSALEGNIGLNAIAQWVATKNTELPQGLGTGQLYANNIPSPLEMRGEELWYSSNQHWGNLSTLQWN